MNFPKFLWTTCLLLAVFDLFCTGMGVQADAVCCSADDKTSSEKPSSDQRKTASDPFTCIAQLYRSTSVPVKVHCNIPETDAPCTGPKKIKKPEPTCDDLKVLNEVQAKQKSKSDARKAAAASSAPDACADTSPAIAKSAEERRGGGCGSSSRRHETGLKDKWGAISAECEQCEIQVKANGDGIFLRCRKCQPATVEAIAFPNVDPDRIMQLP